MRQFSSRHIFSAREDERNERYEQSPPARRLLYIRTTQFVASLDGSCTYERRAGFQAAAYPLRENKRAERYERRAPTKVGASRLVQRQWDRPGAVGNGARRGCCRRSIRSLSGARPCAKPRISALASAMRVEISYRRRGQAWRQNAHHRADGLRGCGCAPAENGEPWQAAGAAPAASLAIGKRLPSICETSAAPRVPRPHFLGPPFLARELRPFIRGLFRLLASTDARPFRGDQPDLTEDAPQLREVARRRLAVPGRGAPDLVF